MSTVFPFVHILFLVFVFCLQIFITITCWSGMRNVSTFCYSVNTGTSLGLLLDILCVRASGLTISGTFQNQIHSFELAQPNIYPTDELLQCVKGPVLQIQNYRHDRVITNDFFSIVSKSKYVSLTLAIVLYWNHFIPTTLSD